jgi:hypothetical protein
MIKQTAGITCVLGLLAAVFTGCSSSDPETGNGSGGTSSAGTSSTGGSAGTSSSGGSAGTSSSGGSAGTSSSGGSGGGVNPPGCQGIGKGDACTMDGQMCLDLVCGLADSGTRDCNCADSGTGTTTWNCTSCDFTNSPFATRPADIGTCDAAVHIQDNPCTVENEVCENAPGGEACACYRDDEDMLIWDCDDPPWE